LAYYHQAVTDYTTWGPRPDDDVIGPRQLAELELVFRYIWLICLLLLPKPCLCVPDMMKCASQVVAIFPNRKSQLQVGKNGVETKQTKCENLAKFHFVYLCKILEQTKMYDFCQLYCGLNFVK